MPIHLTCSTCDTSITLKPSKAKQRNYCSPACRHEALRVPRFCQDCNAPVANHRSPRCAPCAVTARKTPRKLCARSGCDQFPKQPQSRFCSLACRNASYVGQKATSNRIARVCEHCHGDFTAWPHAIEAGNARYCSRRCFKRAQARFFLELPAGDPPISGVYAIVHTESGRAYVGASGNVRQRWTAHRYELTRGSSEHRPLQEAWTEYGGTAFEWRILERVPRGDLRLKEREWMRKLGALTGGFNVNP